MLAAAAMLAVTDAAAALDAETALGRWTIGGYGEGYVVVRTDHDTRQQRPAAILALHATGDIRPWARVHLDTRFTGGGTPEDADGFGVYNLSDTFQNLDPVLEFEEGYAELFFGPVDLRLGKQKFAWGKLDTFQPTDVLNPRRYNDPFLVDEIDAKIGIPAAAIAYYPPALDTDALADLRLGLVWVPVPVATRFPLTRERWFPPATSVREVVRVPPLDLLPATPIVVQNELDTENREPPHQLDEGAVGLRASGVSRGLDWSLYFYDGQETQPSFDFATSIVWPRARRALRLGEQPALPPPGEPLRLRSDSLLLPSFERMRLVGADGAVEAAGFTLRGEAAYGMDRLLPRSIEELISDASIRRAVGPPDRQGRIAAKLAAGERVPIDLGDLFATSDTVEWGLGVDHVYRGWAPLLQVLQTAVLDDVPRLLISRVDTRVLFILRKAFLDDRLSTDTAVLQGLARGYTTGIVRLTYDVTDHLRVRAGYLLIAGSRQTLIGQFHDNDQSFFQIRYSF